VRTLDDAHVQALAGSIKLQGILVPVVVRDDGDNGFELVAGSAWPRCRSSCATRRPRTPTFIRRGRQVAPRDREHHVMPTSA